jgi:hypothetical protein
MVVSFSIRYLVAANDRFFFAEGVEDVGWTLLNAESGGIVSRLYKIIFY